MATTGEFSGDRTPRVLEHPGREPAVLAFHGFSGTPYEVELVMEAAADVGLRGRAPFVAGHGTNVRELAGMRRADWMGAAERELLALPAPMIVAGLSLGSLLALGLAVLQPSAVRGLILMANAVWLKAPFPRWPLAIADRLRIPDFVTPKGPPDLSDPEKRRTHVAYRQNPSHAAIEVLRAGRDIRERLGDVRCPLLILHGARDRVCPVSNAWRVAERVSSTDVRVVVLPKSHHILTRDVERDQARAEITAFLQRISWR